VFVCLFVSFVRSFVNTQPTATQDGRRAMGLRAAGTWVGDHITLALRGPDGGSALRVFFFLVFFVPKSGRADSFVTSER